MNSILKFFSKAFLRLNSFMASCRYRRLLDRSFATEMRNASRRFAVSFSPKNLYFLQRACKHPEFDTQIGKIHSPQTPPSTQPLLTVVILSCGSAYDLERCMFFLSKQTEQNLEIVIANHEFSQKYRKVLKRYPVTCVTLRGNSAAYNAHALIADNVTGKYTIYLRSTDLIHPAFCREIITLAEAEQAELTLSGCATGSLPPFPLIRTGGERLSWQEYLRNESGAFECSNSDLFGKLLLSEKWKKTLEVAYPLALTPWLPFLHTLEYTKNCTTFARTHAALRQETSPVPARSQAREFAACLKGSMPDLIRKLQAALPASEAAIILERLVFSSIPATLSRLMNNPLSSLEKAVIYSHTAFYLTACRELFPVQWDALIAATFASMHYAHGARSSGLYAVHAYFIEQEAKNPEGFLALDVENMEDLRHNFLDLLQSQYPVDYLRQRRQDGDTILTHLAFSILASRRVAIIATAHTAKQLTSDRKVIQLWHGCGMMKKSLPLPEKYQHEYVLASSEICRAEFSEMFRVSPQNVLVFGTIQTDKYFDESKITPARARAHKEFPDLAGRRNCLFAPTYRRPQGVKAHYFSGWQYDNIDDLLSAANTAIIYRQHHLLKNVLQNNGEMNTDLHDSPGGFVRESMLSDIFDWMCACDIFMTDYSSAMFYALLLNKPLVFYAPDLDSYLERTAGIFIDYRGTVPGPIVETPSMDALLAAMDEAPSYVGTAKYETFKQYHMGACDGRARERLLHFLAAWYPEEKRRLARESAGV